MSSGRNRRVILQSPQRITSRCPTCRASSNDQRDSFFDMFISGIIGLDRSSGQPRAHSAFCQCQLPTQVADVVQHFALAAGISPL